MTRFRTLTVLLATLALLLAACGNDDADDGDNGADAPQMGDNGELDLADEPGDQPEPPEGAAAQVGAVEIPEATLEDLFDEISASPSFEGSFEGDEGEVMGAVLRAEILGQLIAQEIILQAAAEEFDFTIGEDEIDAAYADLATQFGGEEELDAQLEVSGLSRDVFERLELPMLTALLFLEEEFGVENGVDAEGQPSEAQQELQNWAFDRFATTEVLVSSNYGAWNSQAGQVEPPMSPEFDMAPGDMAPEPGAEVPVP